MEKLLFPALKLDGSNYMTWVLNAEINLTAKELYDPIDNPNDTIVNKAKAVALIRHHLCEPLQDQYMDEFDPKKLWDQLKERFDHLKTVILPSARFDWQNLRLQDFKTVSEYNGELFKISNQLAACGHPITEEDKLEKNIYYFSSI